MKVFEIFEKNRSLKHKRSRDDKVIERKMRWEKFQFGRKVLATAAIVALPGFCLAQKPHPDRPPQPPHADQAHPTNTNRPPANHNAQPPHPNASAPAHPNTNRNTNQEPNTNFNNGNSRNNSNGVRNGTGANYYSTPRQQLGVGAARPWVDQMRDLSPQQRDRVLQNSRAFQNLSPDKQAKIRQQFNQWDRMTPMQQADLRQKETTWRNLTPEQREHIKSDVLPKWRAMPWDRQQVIKQKLGVLQNMPESARNQRLSDPNFTRGLSDEEKSTLQDLSHTHVGAPEPPTE